MEFFDVIKNRYSFRSYNTRIVEKQKINKIIDAVNTAPSAGNLQAYEVYIVRSEEKKKALSKAAFNQTFLIEAPICLVFCANSARSRRRYGTRGETLYSIQDATIAATFAMLAIVDLGLSSVWVGAFDEEEVASVIGSTTHRPIAILPVGYAVEKPQSRIRRANKDVFHESD